MRAKYVFMAVMALICGATMSQAKMLRGYSTSDAEVTGGRASASGVMALAVDSIDFRSDLTRVYARVWGRPNTSQRIDAATLTLGKRSRAWTDVDGIEMKHYFQFEEDGMIPLEIDFPAAGAERRGSLTFVTVHGTYTYHLR